MLDERWVFHKDAAACQAGEGVVRMSYMAAYA